MNGAARRNLGAWGAPLVLFTAYAVALGLLIVSSVIDFANARDLEKTSAAVSRTIAAQEKLRTIVNTMFVAESAQRGFLLTGNADYLGPYQRMRQRVESRLDEVGAAVSDTPAQRAALMRLRALATDKFAEMQATLDAYRDAGPAAAQSRFAQGSGVASTEAIREVIGAMMGEETRVLGERRAIASDTYTKTLFRALAATIVVAIALTVFYLLMHRYVRQRDAALQVVEANNAVLEQRVVERTGALAQLSRHLLEVREEEKKVIARDLHDDFGSYLTAINMDVSRARDKIAATHPEQAAKLERTLGLLNSAIELKRRLISELRPSMLDNLGLGPALEQYIEEWSQRTGVRASFDHEGELATDVEGSLISIFRIFQEALHNIARHARATRVAAYVYRTDDAIEFEIADDGVGITDADRGKSGVHGLLGIRERVLAYGGQLEITRGAQGGTVVRGSMPCVTAAPAVVPEAPPSGAA